MQSSNAPALKGIMISAAIALAALGALPALADDAIVIQKSKPLVSQSTKPQHFMDFVTINPGQENLKLSMTFNNGSKGDKTGKGKTPGFNWLRVSVGGDPVLTEDNCQNKSSFNVDMTGNMASGNSQILVEAGGVPGATLSWVITTVPVTLNDIKPDSGTPGDKVTLTGTNFSTKTSVDQVKMGDKDANIVSAAPTSIVATIPDGLKAGDNNVSVTVAGQTTKTVKLKIKPVPELSALSLISAPPEQELTITGKNFSTNMSENKVMFGDMAAPISSGDATSLNIAVPAGIHDPQYRVPVTVVTNGVKSKNFLYIDIQNRVYGAEP